MDYLEFLKSKKDVALASVDKIECKPHHNAKIHQQFALDKLLKIGRGAAFLDTGLGKTFLQVDWARHVGGRVLIVAPLGVTFQTVREARELLDVTIRTDFDGTVLDGITITNYESLHKFDADYYKGIVLDESSILKGKNSKTKNQICDMFDQTPYRLACTATPSPNDYTELGNHAEFLGVMNTQEMLTRWFLHDSANTGDWRLKKHAVEDFWKWVASWAVCITKPSDVGGDDTGYDLPPLDISTHTIEEPLMQAEDMLFDIPSVSASDLHKIKRITQKDRCEEVAAMVNASDKPWIVWCESNDENDLLKKLIPDAVDVKGSHTVQQKEERLIGFTDGKYRVIISKPSIAGFGMNWQHCRKIAFASISYSYEKFYQAVRRSWRFGQDQSVSVHVFLSSSELTVWRAIEKKTNSHDEMKKHMRLVADYQGRTHEVKIDYKPNKKATLPTWL